MKPYALYMKACPGADNPRDYKIGVADLEGNKLRKRLAAYQNAVGPVHEEKYTRVFVGDEKQIKFAEKQFKRVYKDKIGSKEAGFSEWISDITLEELIEFVQELRSDYFTKIHDVPEQFEPCNMATCEDIKDWFEETFLQEKVDK